MVETSAKASSVLMISMSPCGSMVVVPSARWILVLEKARTTWHMASHWRILAKNLLPNPSPLLAPATNPATSTNSTVAGTILSVLYILARTPSRASGTGTIPVLGLNGSKRVIGRQYFAVS